MKRATVKEVAKMAGVSTATVSNVLTGRKYVSDEVKERVHSVMKN
ncbi:LacI family DNA-binding transcriptional regulator [Paenibacillus cisolokensis]|nr:LacI family DNA-binding transcriptional regulator [Paenibacillus cisolokensis]